MSPIIALARSSLGKKYIMAGSGLVLVLFVMGHMLGNLQVFADPVVINTYAHNLQSLGPLLWLVRLFLLTCLVAHVVTAVMLTIENKRGRGGNYQVEDYVKASYAARTMPVTGLIVLAFIIFHILHYTAKVVYDYGDLLTTLPSLKPSEKVPDVHAMMVSGFGHWYVSLFYGVAIWLLCMHLSHGVSAMFQSVGLRTEKWRKFIDDLARWYGVVIFLGFVSIPVCVSFGLVTNNNYPGKHKVRQVVIETVEPTPAHPALHRS